MKKSQNAFFLLLHVGYTGKADDAVAVKVIPVAVAVDDLWRKYVFFYFCSV